MKKISLVSLHFLAVIGTSVIANHAVGQQVLPGFSSILRFHESKPVTVNDAQFVVIAETDWRPVGKVEYPVEIQLRITNLGKKDLIFPTLGSIRLKLTTADDKKIWPQGGSNGQPLTKAILIPKGKSYTLARKAEILPDEATGAVRKLYYWDASATVQIFGPLRSGEDKLSFSYFAEPYASTAIRHISDRKAGDAEIWNGMAMTEQVPIKIVVK